MTSPMAAKSRLLEVLEQFSDAAWPNQHLERLATATLVPQAAQHERGLNGVHGLQVET